MSQLIEKKNPRKTGTKPLTAMRANVAGIDIGSRQMHVCGPMAEDGSHGLAVFETTTTEILACAKWLRELGVESVAMESTGVYWIPPLELLEGQGFEVILTDTRPLSRVPGRKSDVSDCEWIQILHSRGLLQGCYRPSDTISQLRTLVRCKAVVVSGQADWQRRIQKCLDQMNVRVHQAVSDISGTTGMSIVRAIVGGERDPLKLAELRDARCHKSKEQIAEYLTGHWRPDHLFNLEHALKLYDFHVEQIAAYERKIQEQMKELTPPESGGKTAAPLANRERTKAMKRRKQEGKRQQLYQMVGVDLTTIDGVGVETAEVIISEYGVDLSKFEDEKQFVAHMQLAPNRPVSGGKPIAKRRHKPRNTRAAQALRTAATAASRGSTAIGAYYRRISRSKDAGVAVFATARKIGMLIYRMLRWGQAYVDEGQRSYEARYQASRIRSLAATAKQFGLQLVKQSVAVNP